MGHIFSRIMLFCFLVFIILGAYNCGKEEITDEPKIDSIRLDTSRVSYSQDVLKVLNNGNCTGCHSDLVKNGGISVEGHSNLKTIALDGKKLLGSITHKKGYKPMPLDAAKLSEERIWVIERWINQGCKDN